MYEVLVQGILLGLSTGVFCMSYCAPVFVPLIMSGDGKLNQNVRVIAELATGRLASYLSVGGIAGYFGILFESPFFGVVSGFSMVLLSVLLLFFGFTRGWPHFAFCRWIGERHLRFPFFIGLLTGVNICPPFLLAINQAFGIGIIGGLLLFGGFFAGTSVYLILLLPLGYLGKVENIQIIAFMTTILTGLFYLVSGLLQILASN